MDYQTLIIPGLGGSGPQHWQTFWEKGDGSFIRVIQDDWDHPDLAAWLDRLNIYITRAEHPLVLVAHSLACSLVAHWSLEYGDGIMAALLVAPADVDAGVLSCEELRGFGPMPMKRLPFRSTVLASTDDPFVTPGRAEAFARAWGSHFHCLGARGHINAESNLKDWPEGKEFFQKLVESL